MPLRIGLTGGLGSGKTTVAKVFEVLGVPVYYADDAAKRIMNSDPEVRKQIINHFGSKSYSASGLNRQYLAAMVFHDKQKLDLLNSIVHPVTINDAEEWMRRQTAAYAIKEAALIFESGAQKDLDLVIGVSAPVSLSIHRAMKRDSLSREEVKRRMDRQISDTIKMRLCDHVILNDEQTLVIPQVLELHRQLMEKSSMLPSLN
jgi:dephospho-CoA kinase